MSLMKKIVKIFPSKKMSAAELKREADKKQRIEAASHGKQRGYEDFPDDEGKINGEYEIIEREYLPERIKCPRCGGTTWEGLEVCDKCGGNIISNAAES